MDVIALALRGGAEHRRVPLERILQLMGYRQRWNNPPLVHDGKPDVNVWNPGHVGQEDATMPGVKRAAVAILEQGKIVFVLQLFSSFFS